MSDNPRLSDREMLLLVADQQRRLEQLNERLSQSLEQRLGEGARRFAELDTRMTNSDQRHAASNNAINVLNGRLLDAEKQANSRAIEHEKTLLGLRADHAAALAKLDAAVAAADKKAETTADEFHTWKVRAQTVATILGLIWAFVQFALPYLVP